MVKESLRAGVAKGSEYELKEEHLSIWNFLAAEMRRRGLHVEETSPLPSRQDARNAGRNVHPRGRGLEKRCGQHAEEATPPTVKARVKGAARKAPCGKKREVCIC